MSNVFGFDISLLILSFQANCVDPDQTAPSQDQEQSDLGLQCLPFHLYLLDALLCARTTLLKFRMITAKFFGVRIFSEFTVLHNSVENVLRV